MRARLVSTPGRGAARPLQPSPARPAGLTVQLASAHVHVCSCTVHVLFILSLICKMDDELTIPEFGEEFTKKHFVLSSDEEHSGVNLTDPFEDFQAQRPVDQPCSLPSKIYRTRSDEVSFKKWVHIKRVGLFRYGWYQVEV